MIKTHILEVGSFEVNCIVIDKGHRAMVVDPGSEASRIAVFLQKQQLELAAIALTHGHFDHINGVPGLLINYPKVPVLVTADDAAIMNHPFNAYPPEYDRVTLPPANWLAPDAGGFAAEFGFAVLPMPGHTPGGVAYYFATEDLLLSGDTLFAGSVGRTDLPGASGTQLMESLKILKQLPPSTRVIPGHGRATTIGAQLQENPFFK